MRKFTKEVQELVSQMSEGMDTFYGCTVLTDLHEVPPTASSSYREREAGSKYMILVIGKNKECYGRKIVNGRAIVDKVLDLLRGTELC